MGAHARSAFGKAAEQTDQDQFGANTELDADARADRQQQKAVEAKRQLESQKTRNKKDGVFDSHSIVEFQPCLPPHVGFCHPGE